MDTPVGYLYWYTTSAILGILTLINIGSHIVHIIFTKRHVAPEVLPPIVAGTESPSSDITAVEMSIVEKGEAAPAVPSRAPGSVRRLCRAAVTGWNKYAMLTAVRIPTTNQLRKKRAAKAYMPTSEVAWTLGYLVGCLVLTFYGSERRSLVSVNVFQTDISCVGYQDLLESSWMAYRRPDAPYHLSCWQEQLCFM